MLLSFRNISRLERCLCQQVQKYCTSIETDAIKPIISSTDYIDTPKFYNAPREVWLESLDTIEDKKLGLMKLHPDVFAAMPRIDIIHENIRWQRMYRYISYKHTETRAERRGGGRKPWPQKGTGRARHGSVRSPLWLRGGRAHGPRAFTTHFFMLPFYTRVLGLTSALSIKLAQDDLHVVSDLEMPSNEPSYLLNLIDKRNWGPSVLIIDKNDIIPENLAIAAYEIKQVNVMPVYGLNVYSMIKHNTLVLTEAAVREIEKKILTNVNRADGRNVMAKFKVNQQ